MLKLRKFASLTLIVICLSACNGGNVGNNNTVTTNNNQASIDEGSNQQTVKGALPPPPPVQDDVVIMEDDPELVDADPEGDAVAAIALKTYAMYYYCSNNGIDSKSCLTATFPELALIFYRNQTLSLLDHTLYRGTLPLGMFYKDITHRPSINRMIHQVHTLACHRLGIGCDPKHKAIRYVDGYPLNHSLNAKQFREKDDSKHPIDFPTDVLIENMNQVSPNFMYGFQGLEPQDVLCETECPELKLPTVPEYVVYSWQSKGFEQDGFKISYVGTGIKVADGMTTNGYHVVIYKINENDRSGVVISATDRQMHSTTLNITKYVQVQLPFFYSEFYNPNFFPQAVDSNNTLLKQFNPNIMPQDLIFTSTQLTQNIDDQPSQAFAPATVANYQLEADDNKVVILNKSYLSASNFSKNPIPQNKVYFSDITSEFLPSFDFTYLKPTYQDIEGDYQKDFSTAGAFGSIITTPVAYHTLDSSLCAYGAKITFDISKGFECSKYNEPPLTDPHPTIINSVPYQAMLFETWDGNKGEVRILNMKTNESKVISNFACPSTKIVSVDPNNKDRLICSDFPMPTGSYQKVCNGITFNSTTDKLTAHCEYSSDTKKYDEWSSLNVSGCIANSIVVNKGQLACSLAPVGSYQETCSSVSFESGILRANCSITLNGLENNTTILNYAKNCVSGTTVSNNNGQLICDIPVPPLGQYLQFKGKYYNNIEWDGKNLKVTGGAAGNSALLHYTQICSPGSTVSIKSIYGVPVLYCDMYAWSIQQLIDTSSVTVYKNKSTNKWYENCFVQNVTLASQKDAGKNDQYGQLKAGNCSSDMVQYGYGACISNIQAMCITNVGKIRESNQNPNATANKCWQSGTSVSGNDARSLVGRSENKGLVTFLVNEDGHLNCPGNMN